MTSTTLKPLPWLLTFGPLVVGAITACEGNKTDSGAESSASESGPSVVTAVTTGTTAATTSTTTTTTAESMETTLSEMTSGGTTDATLASTGPGIPEACEERMSEEDCNIDNYDPELERCHWAYVVTWDEKTQCPDLNNGVGTCVTQSFTNECIENPTCQPARIFYQLGMEGIHRIFAHSHKCGDPLYWDSCHYEISPVVCDCFGCQNP